MALSKVLQTMFDPLRDVVFSIKDRQGRYVLISEACVKRCGLNCKEEAIGKTAFALFPKPMAERYCHQDERLFQTGKPLIDSLDLTVHNDGSTGWCLSTKQPLWDLTGAIVGLTCVSRDLIEPSRARMIDNVFADTIDHIREHFMEKLLVPDLAQRASLSEAQFERRMKRIFQLSAGQYLMKVRIDAATRLLQHSEESISGIAYQVGFFDQSLMSRAFRRVTGMTPGQYRRIFRDFLTLQKI
ncbi:AraC family transcriptional regulator [Dyella tabacisoli]|uniref:AraC family transcriptional regulator n=2 Tax=Dyella tabacisoli TaxID=2282381 RepID=A0A369UHA4_9GAMM|nr:AraC family transcriptional regulator [Dyella tabacisoli]